MTTLNLRAFSISQFCAAHSISRATFYNLRKSGLAPRIMKVGRRTLITDEAATEWRRRTEELSDVLVNSASGEGVNPAGSTAIAPRKPLRSLERAPP